jgi:translation initiation factor IF-1
MVRNANGGNKGKGVARKHITGAREPKALRLSSCELERYGAVIRVLGNGMFYVATDEHPQLLGRIRNKFKGRSKRDNMISLGSVVLIGLREWEHPNYKECDLLEVYDANEVRQLMKNPSIDFVELQRYIDAHQSASSESTETAIGCGVIEFTEERDYMEGLIPTESDLAARTGASETKEEIINIDDL